MKKTRILSVLTVAAIAVSSVATYAVWDTVTATSRQQTVTMRNPVTISDTTVETEIDAEAASLNPASVTADGAVKFNVQNTDSLAKSLVLSENVQAGGQGKMEEITDYTIVYSGTGVSGKTDSSVTNGEETYNYTITFTESGLNKLEQNSNQCTVQITAELQ